MSNAKLNSSNSFDWFCVLTYSNNDKYIKNSFINNNIHAVDNGLDNEWYINGYGNYCRNEEDFGVV